MADNQAKLTITVSPNGNVRVEGPVDQLMFCYGLLEAAKDVIRTHAQKKTKSAIVPISDMMPGNGRR